MMPKHYQMHTHVLRLFESEDLIGTILEVLTADLKFCLLKSDTFRPHSSIQKKVTNTQHLKRYASIAEADSRQLQS